MSGWGNKLLAGFLVFSGLLLAVAMLLREDAAIGSDAGLEHRGPSAGADTTEEAAVDSGVDSPAPASAPAAAAAAGLTLVSYDLEEPTRRFKLPKRLREISGLAMLAGNRLLAHDDERGVIVEIGLRDGSIAKAFALGDGRDPVADDFEGIAAAEGRLYLVSSAGRLYEFGEGEDGGAVLYNSYATGVGRDYEIEGLAYDPDQRVLLLVSKNPRSRGQAGLIAIYRWSVDTKEFAEVGRIVLEASALARRIDQKKFQPSGIERHPVSGNYFLVAARQRAVAEITPRGRVVAVMKLAAGRHPQAEGIAFAADNTLIIADEGAGKRARLSFYAVAEGR